ncbi:hypothetical protein BDV37DRAFT_280885 [Aspergillus pseudonomiae]|uniref:Transcription factor domain-containing protein n=1 Tax=Aspergillus pseudonomiae TaxID=1506151 RepID=A0A5N7DIM3_9EURO|nr:uncharacterized protein BDV37DRAFT_280885 [Aspergillus pseudonomiae]KAE8406290.1 hypothetical protein BDV37DRAFT_280885 [Aspergillus pseudonomiae]
MPCRRCQALKLECGFATNKVKDTKEPKVEEGDVLSGLFDAQPSAPPPKNVVDVHRQIFETKFDISGQQSSRTLLDDIPDDTTLRPPVLDQKKADQLLSKFRAKSSYFPFVTLPGNIASAQHRFLYLAVLTAASSDDMYLLRSLDNRFRSVLADRVVNAGEKSLDYLQGLLVYIAWYNLHLRPRSFQSYQYLQIAISMVEDLGLDDGNITHTEVDRSSALSGSEALNACLGCYYLSSVIATGSKRDNRVTLSSNLISYLLRLSQGECPRGTMIYSCIRLQMAIEAAYKGAEKPDRLWPADSRLTSDPSLNIPSINIARLTLSLLEEASIHRLEPTLLEFDLPKFQSIMRKARAFLDYFISVPTSNYHRFSFTEWDRLIAAIRVSTEILSAAAGLPGIVAAVGEESQTLTRYLECLANRMEKVSQSGRNPGEFPDIFYLFKSVLDLLCPLPLAATYDQGMALAVNYEPRRSMQRCPVLSSIQETEFWDAYQTCVPADDIDIDLETLFTNEYLSGLSSEEWVGAPGNISYT